jgi:hypothetical protein
MALTFIKLYRSDLPMRLPHLNCQLLSIPDSSTKTPFAGCSKKTQSRNL